MAEPNDAWHQQPCGVFAALPLLTDTDPIALPTLHPPGMNSIGLAGSGCIEQAGHRTKVPGDGPVAPTSAKATWWPAAKVGAQKRCTRLLPAIWSRNLPSPRNGRRNRERPDQERRRPGPRWLVQQRVSRASGGLRFQEDPTIPLALAGSPNRRPRRTQAPLGTRRHRDHDAIAHRPSALQSPLQQASPACRDCPAAESASVGTEPGARNGFPAQRTRQRRRGLQRLQREEGWCKPDAARSALLLRWLRGVGHPGRRQQPARLAPLRCWARSARDEASRRGRPASGRDTMSAGFGGGSWSGWPLQAVGDGGAGCLSIACGGGLPASACLRACRELKCAGTASRSVDWVLLLEA